jgi:hypothetical protein
MTPDARIIHHGAASEPVRADKIIRLLSARTLLMQRHWASGWRSAGRVLLLAWVASRWIGFSLARGIGLRLAGVQGEAWKEVWRRRTEWDTRRPTWAQAPASDPMVGDPGRDTR